MSSLPQGECTYVDETTWIDLVIEVEPIDERTWKDALVVDDCETTAIDLRLPDEVEEVGVRPVVDEQVLEARLAIRAALKDAHRARIAAQQAQTQSALTRMMITRLVKATTSTPEVEQRSTTGETIERAQRWMVSCRARAYHAARRAQATAAIARRACSRLGLTAEMFQHAFEHSIRKQAELELLPTAV